MDATIIATIASTTVSLLVPYLKSLADEFSKKAGQEMGEMAWVKAAQLYDKVKAKLSSQPEAAKVISSLEESPDDKDTQAALRFYLKDVMSLDESFAKELALTLKEASEAGADTVFNTTIMGNVRKLVQMGNVYGSVKI